MDIGTFRKLALAELEPVHRLAFHLCRDCHEAEDMVQETYLRAFRTAAAFVEMGYGVRPWLFKILNNVVKPVVRSCADNATPSPACSAGSDTRPIKQTFPAATSPATNTMNWEELDERLFHAIHALPVPHRVVVLLSAVEEMSYREIADVVGLPIGTVMSRLSRARKVLAVQLRDLAGDRNLKHRTTETRPKADAEPAA